MEENLNETIPAYDATPYPQQRVFYLICGSISVIVNVVAVYLYQRRSDSSVKVYKEYLTALQVFSGTFCIYTCLFMMPTTIPKFGGYCTGPLTIYLNIPCHLQNIVCTVSQQLTLTTVLCCVLYRHQAVQMNSSKFRMPTRLHGFVVVLLYLRVATIGSIFYFCEVDKTSQVEYLTEFQPELLVVYNYNTMAYNQILVKLMRIYVAFLSISMLFDTLATVSLTVHSFYSIQSLAKQGSTSLKRNGHWLHTLALQCFVPIATVFLPSIVLTATLTSQAALEPIGKVIANVSLCVTCVYSIANSLVVIARTPSYKRALARKPDRVTTLNPAGKSHGTHVTAF